MKLLKAEKKQGYFLDVQSAFCLIDKITKEDLLRLAGLVLSEDDVEFDEYDEGVIGNEAHRILYKNILEKLQDLRDRREEFLDKQSKLYQEAFEQYKSDVIPKKKVKIKKKKGAG